MSNQTTDELTLLPCPFCGGQALPFTNLGGYWYVGCLPCDAEGPPSDTEVGARVGWNARLPREPVHTGRYSDYGVAPVGADQPHEPGERQPERLKVGDKVSIHTPGPLLSADGWHIESLPQSQLFVLSHADGSKICLTRFDFTVVCNG